MWRSRTFWRLFLSCASMAIGLIALLGAVLLWRVESHTMDQMEERLRTEAVLGAEMVRGHPAEAVPALQRRFEAMRQRQPLRITLLAADGTVLVDSDRDPQRYSVPNHGDRPEVVEARARGAGVSRSRHSETVGQDLMYVAIRTDDARGAVAFVRAAWPLADVRAQLAELGRIVWSAAGVAAALALALSFWLARRITRPLHELTAGAERVAAGEYSPRVYAAGRDEVATLARTFNEMSSRLAAQFAQLAEDGQQLRMILSGMVEGVVALDADQRILFANARATQLLGLAPEVTGRRLWEVVRRRALQDLVQKCLSEPEPRQEEMTWDGAVAKSLTVHAARLPGSPPRGAVLVLHDTTELRRLEGVRRDFVANVSHELKTPLSVIKANVETLLDGALDDAEHRGSFLERIAEQADRLHALILDLLSLARVESGSEAFVFQTIALGPLVGDCLERHRARAEGKRQLLEHLPPDPGDRGAAATAWADEEAVRQILDNLVDNALKYTPEGGRITVRWRAADGQACLEVEDTGVGIPEQDLPRVFERFYRVDKARSRELGGTGLGLAIVKHLVQAMQGGVSVANRPGGGATFAVRLPAAPG
jgi:two-component system phosphate regulon sensor histidine kinase PhoR